MNAYLILEDGTVYTGTAIGALREVISEIVFNTSMTGYLEVLTDPSYAGQSVVMTYPLIGNYGICQEDMESRQPWPDAFILRRISHIPSNWRSENTLQNFLKTHGVPGIVGIDTRALTRKLRDHGTMNGCITTKRYEGEGLKQLLETLQAYRVQGVVQRTTAKQVYELTGEAAHTLEKRDPYLDVMREVEESEQQETVTAPGTALLSEGLTETSPWQQTRKKRIALLDLGAKDNIARSLVKLGCDVTVYPAQTPAREILAARPDGIMLSNGPGDPKECTGIIREIRRLYESEVPIFAICLGHQLMALATGADTYKLKYGHRGGNHPVKDLQTGKVYISSQNHGYAVDMGSVNEKVAVEAFQNVNDGTNEGLRYLQKPVLTVQFHPEASPGPWDLGYLFGEFFDMMEKKYA